MRKRYLRWTAERVRLLSELFAAGYDVVGAAARISVIVGEDVSEDMVRMAARRAGLEPAAGRRVVEAPFEVMRSAPDLPSYFRAPPPSIAIGIQALERERLRREAEEAKQSRSSRVIILDGAVSDDEVQRRVDDAWTQLWAEFCEAESEAGRVPTDEARAAAEERPPPWFLSWASVMVVEVVEVDGRAAEGRLVPTLGFFDEEEEPQEEPTDD